MIALNPIGQQFALQLARVTLQEDKKTVASVRAKKVNIVGAGGALTAAYEQLRNAAENTEEHLLLQNAIKRFFKQLFILGDEQLVAKSGNELAVELTLAGYVPNDSLTRAQIDTISTMAVQHYRVSEELINRREYNQEKITGWVLDTLSAEVEKLLSSHARDDVFVDFAYAHFSNILINDSNKKKSDETAVMVFAAIRKALLESNTALIRTAILNRYNVTIEHPDQYAAFNARVDRMLGTKKMDRLYHAVNRGGAPFRIIRRMIETRDDFASCLESRERFLDAFEKQIVSEYARIESRVNRAVVRSVIFLIITKFLIGIAIEVPYDIWSHGSIIWVPLIVNLFFPPAYMVLLKLTNVMPGFANTTGLVDRVDTMLYGDSEQLTRSERKGERYGPVFSLFYGLFSLLIFGLATWGLFAIGFSIVHIIIFFVFISAASFLSFRLSRLIREIEVVRPRSNGLTLLRDFIYLPFVVVGRWMSEKYSQINIVALILDMVIELPLKTVLRIVRQWSAFIDDRKDKI